jgi:Cyclic GMP-AMP synthase DncV-like, nucleotidyltransferase domain
MDAHKLVSSFRKEHIDLTRAQQADMKSRRDTNLERVKKGLEAKNWPAVAETINQGGYAMKTMTQQPEKDDETRWDIDLGVVFEEDDAVGARLTRNRVCEALAEKTKNLKITPELKNKCVRIVYAEGYQVDLPVFKRIEKNDGTYTYEVSLGNEWTASDPKAINKWFSDSCSDLSPEASNFQLRRIVRMMKYFAKVRALATGSKFPGGLLITALTVNNYVAHEGRDDLSFRDTLSAMQTKLLLGLPIYANGVRVDRDQDNARLTRLRESVESATSWLDAPGDDATAEKVRAAWKKVFRHTYFDSDDAKKQLGETSATVNKVHTPENERLAAAGSPPWSTDS